jgi:hypothetical protein
MLGVPADEIPRPLWDRIEAAMEDVYADSEAPGWDPLRLPEPLATTWAVYKTQNIVDNENLDFFFQNDWQFHKYCILGTIQPSLSGLGCPPHHVPQP